MKDINWLKENYLNFLEEKQGNYKRSIANLQEKECLDEANLEKVRLNIVEIFYKMFTISFSDKAVELEEKYLGFFHKITKPWYINKEKALKFGEEKEVIIEDIKIQEAEELKSRFKEYFKEIHID